MGMTAAVATSFSVGGGFRGCGGGFGFLGFDGGEGNGFRHDIREKLEIVEARDCACWSGEGSLVGD